MSNVALPPRLSWVLNINKLDCWFLEGLKLMEMNEPQRLFSRDPFSNVGTNVCDDLGETNVGKAALLAVLR